VVNAGGGFDGEEVIVDGVAAGEQGDVGLELEVEGLGVGGGELRLGERRQFGAVEGEDLSPFEFGDGAGEVGVGGREFGMAAEEGGKELAEVAEGEGA
jgi:hypothetical protein